MSDAAIPYRFARAITAVEATIFSRSSCGDNFPSQGSVRGSRSRNEKLKKDKDLDHPLLRSAFGRSED